jgi:hypothetical protein
MSSSFRITLNWLICIAALGGTLYAYINKHNELIQLQIEIPALAKEVKAVQEENNRLSYEIEQFESPLHLMELLRKPEFSHLKYPNGDEIIVIQEGVKK